jgi:hypothetical protein
LYREGCGRKKKNEDSTNIVIYSRLSRPDKKAGRKARNIDRITGIFPTILQWIISGK